jgi:hypothetical protein
VNITIGKLVLLFVLSFCGFNAYANFQCYAMDSGGHTWTSEGLTEEHANTVALSFCSAYSPDSGSCHMSKCETK